MQSSKTTLSVYPLGSYDPLGFALPSLLTGCQILQDLHQDKAEWDDHFSDTSTTGYGQCSDALVVNKDQKIHHASLWGNLK